MQCLLLFLQLHAGISQILGLGVRTFLKKISIFESDIAAAKLSANSNLGWNSAEENESG